MGRSLSCDNCRVLAETVKTLGEALAARERKTTSIVQHPGPEVRLGFDPLIEQAVARRAGGDERLRAYLQDYALSAISAGTDAKDIAQAIMDGETE